MMRTALWAAVAFFGTGAPSRAEETSALRRGLAAAAGSWRPLEARPSGGFAHGPFPASAPPSDLEALARTTAAIQSAAATTRSGPALADLGVAWLLARRTQDGVAHLEEAMASSETGPGALLNDLAVGYLARAADPDRAQDLVRALDLLERCGAGCKTLPEATFNRALVLEKLGLGQAAEQEWTAYLVLDNDSAWAGEARQRREALAARPEPEVWKELRPALEAAVSVSDWTAVEAAVGRGLTFARRDALDRYLPAWADASEKKHPGAAAPLAVARAIGDVLARSRGDTFVREAVAEAARSRDVPLARATLVAGYRLVVRGQARLAESRFEQAVADFEDAERSFESVRSPQALRVRCLRAKAAYFRARFRDALDLAEGVRRASAGSTHPALRAESARFVGLVRSAMGRPAEGVEAYRAALIDLATAGSPDDQAAVESLLAENLAALGGEVEAWTPRVEALRRAERFAGSGGTYNIGFEAADAAVASGHPHAALRFFEAAVRAAEACGSQLAVFEILMERSASWERVGRTTEARADRARARGIVETLEDGELKARLLSESLLGEGELQAAREPAVAIGLLLQAQAVLRQTDRSYLLPRTYRALAEAYRATGQNEESERYLSLAITVGERTVWPATAAAARRDPQRRALAEMVHLQFAILNRPERALDYAERARAWRRAALLQGPSEEPVSGSREAAPPCAISASGRTLPEAAQIEYFVLPDRILAWVIAGGRLDSVDIPASEATVRELIEDTLATAEQGLHADLESRLERLYDQLIRPLRHLVPPRARVIFVPDGPLEAVPFGALRDRKARRSLVEDHTIQVASSLHCASEEPPRGTGGSGVLVVGAPAVEATALPTLRPLSGAPREARAIAALYPGSRLLEGAEATRARVLATADHSRLLHFAGHVLGNPERPELSLMPLAPEVAGEPGIVYAGELVMPKGGGRRFASPDLVVLSACGTGLGRHHGPVGLGGLAWSFLAAGARQVVTALWRVEDELTADFMIDFHRNLLTGLDTPTALRHTQLEWIHHVDIRRRAPALWSGFTVMDSQGSRPPNPGPVAPRDP